MDSSPVRRVLPAVAVFVVSATFAADFCRHAAAEDTQPASIAERFQARIGPLLARHCTDCHSGDDAEAKLRLDQAAPVFGTDSTTPWQRVLERVELGQMPPESQPRPSPEEVEALANWIKDGIRGAELARRENEGRVVYRRLNRVEYENTVRDLLGVEIELKELLPPDGTSDGFDNVGEALHTSTFLIDRYLEAADIALEAAIANQPRPQLVKQRVGCGEERSVKQATQSVFRETDDAVVFFSSSAWSSVLMNQFRPQDRGKYRVRISAYAVQTDEPVKLRVQAGPMSQRSLRDHLVGYFDFPPGKPTVIEFEDLFEAGDTIRLLPTGTAGARTIVDAGGAEQFDGAGLAVQWIETEGPLFDTWPPKSHQRIFGDLPQESDPDDRRRVEVTSNDPPGDARRILREFACRAYRCDVTDEELAPLAEVVDAKMSAGYTFEEAVRVGLKGVMVSPRFLFLEEEPGRLTDFALASRLSYFLWSTMPDVELLDLARHGALTGGIDGKSGSEVLAAQVERMLDDPKAAQFTTNFVGQWLDLREIDDTSPDRRLYPEYDDVLKQAMVGEAELFLEEVVKRDLPLTNFTASDFTFVNDRLAEHYGIEGVEGQEMRRVSLPADSHRGGVMTMAGVLKVTANGTTTSPVYRGAFVLDKILGTPPAQPPDGVSAVEPDIRGATTIREQLAQHRELTSCNLCHAKIDPPGFALESFDVMGGWRENYRVRGGQPAVVDGRKQSYSIGPQVKPGDMLTDGRRFADIDELKRLLVDDPDQLARGLAGKLITYATGRAPDLADEPAIDEIVANVRKRNYGTKSLIHAIVQSEIFQHK